MPSKKQPKKPTNPPAGAIFDDAKGLTSEMVRQDALGDGLDPGIAAKAILGLAKKARAARSTVSPQENS